MPFQALKNHVKRILRESFDYHNFLFPGKRIAYHMSKLDELSRRCLAAPLPDGYERLEVERRVRALQDAASGIVVNQDPDRSSQGWSLMCDALRDVEALHLV